MNESTIMRLPKPLHFLLAAVLLASMWLGYWIGHISSSSSSAMPEIVQSEGAVYKVHSQIKASHHLKDTSDMHNQRSKVNKHPQSQPSKNGTVKATNKKQAFDNHDGVKMESKPSFNKPSFNNIDTVVDDKKVNYIKPFERKPPQNDGFNQVKPTKSTKKFIGQSLKEKGIIDALKKMRETKNSIPKNAKPSAGKVRIQNQGLPSKAKPNEDYYYLLHGSQAIKIHGRIHENIRTFPDYVPKSHYIFSSKR